MKDSMTPFARANALANGEAVDRLPCNPNIANGVARIYGCKISEFNTNAKTLANAQIAGYKRFGYDGVRIFTDLFAWAEAMGAEVVAPEDHTADLAKPALCNLADIDTLEPANPYTDGRLPVYLEAMKRVIDAIGHEVGCSAGLVGPFTNAFFLYGVDETMRLLHKNPDAMHTLCHVSLETCKAYAKAAVAIGLTPTISEPLSSCTVVSPASFRTFSLPYLTLLIDFIVSLNKKPLLHICGETRQIWDDIARLDIAGFSIDNVVNLKHCCTQIGDKVKILGHVDPATVMYSGSPTDVRRRTLECILDGYDNPKGYVVMSGCSLPVETPLQNIEAMMETVRGVGYPVVPDKVAALLQSLPAGRLLV